MRRRARSLGLAREVSLEIVSCMVSFVSMRAPHTSNGGSVWSGGADDNCVLVCKVECDTLSVAPGVDGLL